MKNLDCVSELQLSDDIFCQNKIYLQYNHTCIAYSLLPLMMLYSCSVLPSVHRSPHPYLLAPSSAESPSIQKVHNNYTYDRDILDISLTSTGHASYALVSVTNNNDNRCPHVMLTS